MKTLLSVPPADLAAVWSRVRPGLDAMDKGDGWISEDVYLVLKTGGASLYMVTIDGEEHGFMVLRVLNDFDGPRLHIWVLVSNSNLDLMTEFSEELDGLARGVKAGRITFSSTRKGWEKTAPRHGFSVRETVWQRPIQPKLANSP